MPGYGRVTSEGVPVDPASYDYRRAALDALHFPKLIDRFWQNLRRATGYKVQYFAVVEPQRRLAPHLHAAVRGAIPREVIRQVVAATYTRSGGHLTTCRSTSTATRSGTSRSAATSTRPPASPFPSGRRRSMPSTPTRWLGPRT